MYIQTSSSTASSRLQKLMTVNQMVEASIPQVYWTGNESLILVSAHFIAKWGVNVSKDPMSRLFPRRWLDIKGNKVPSFWHAALRSVIGSVIFRPGISQVMHFKHTHIFFVDEIFLHRQRLDGGFGLCMTGKKWQKSFGSCKRKGICNIAWDIFRIANSMLRLMRRKRAASIGLIRTNTGTKYSTYYFTN
jgi:hypothetical protein